MPVEVTEGSPSTWAIPKSVSTTRPSSDDQHVGRLHVAVQDALAVRGAQHVEHRQADLGGAAAG